MHAKKIGDKIRLARKKLNLRQIDLAKKIGLSRATIIAIEYGATIPRYDKMVRLTKLLRIEG